MDLFPFRAPAVEGAMVVGELRSYFRLLLLFVVGFWAFLSGRDQYRRHREENERESLERERRVKTFRTLGLFKEREKQQKRDKKKETEFRILR